MQITQNLPLKLKGKFVFLLLSYTKEISLYKIKKNVWLTACQNEFLGLAVVT